MFLNQIHLRKEALREMEGTMFSSSLIPRGSSYFMVNRILAFFWKDAVNLSDPPPQANIVINS